jgi:hypothetical protein
MTSPTVLVTDPPTPPTVELDPPAGDVDGGAPVVHALPRTGGRVVYRSAEARERFWRIAGECFARWHRYTEGEGK